HGLDIAFFQRLHDTLITPAHDVVGTADTTISARQQTRGEDFVVTVIEHQIWMFATDLFHLIEIARSLFQGTDTWQRNQCVDLIQSQFYPAQSRNVVHHHRQTIRRINNCPIVIAVFFEAERIVERRDGGDGIETITSGRCRKLLAFGGADATDVGDEFNLTFRLFGDDFQYLFTLGKALYKGLAGRTTHV